MTSFSPSMPGVILVLHPDKEPWPNLLSSLRARHYQLHLAQQPGPFGEASLPHQVDLVVMSTTWHTSSPEAICQSLRQHLPGESVPILVIAANDNPDEKLAWLHGGVSDYLTEPVWNAEVEARIHHHIATYRYQQRLQTQARRAVTSGIPTDLLADLQRTLRRQAEQLQLQNEQLQQEVAEREVAEAALRREQQKSEKLLLNILPKAVVEQLKQLQGTLAERFEDVTILFADIVNFTPLAVETSPLELVSWLNRVFSEFDLLAEHYQLEKIKTIGDAYMAVGGLPIPRQDHAAAVLEMAIAMQEATQRVARQDGRPFQLRIGINTGPVVAGVIGIKKFSYDLWGDAVNIASRMEAQGSPGKIQLTEATYQRLRHQYEFEQVGQILVKGRGYMTTYQYVGRRQG